MKNSEKFWMAVKIISLSIGNLLIIPKMIYDFWYDPTLMSIVVLLLGLVTMSVDICYLIEHGHELIVGFNKFLDGEIKLYERKPKVEEVKFETIDEFEK